MIIDAHCHIGNSWLGWLDGLDGTNGAEWGDSLVKLMDKHGIDKACLSSWSHIYDPVRGNDEVFQAMQKHPKRIIGFCVLSPRLRSHGGRDMAGEIDRCVQKFGMKGIKVHPLANEFYADSPALDPALEKAKEYGLPVLFHSGTDSHSHPRVLGNTAKRHPDVNILLGHMGQEACFDAIDVARENPNIFLDTTYSPDYRGLIELAVKQVGADRIVWGSDIPALEVAVELMKVKCVDISEKEKSMIMGGNMARILRL